MNKPNPRVIGILIFAGIVLIALIIKFTTGPSTGGGSISGKVLELKFVNSSAKKGWVDAMVKQFNEAGHKVDGYGIVIRASHGNSGEQLDQIKEGKLAPDLWSPGDESWLEMAAAHWKNINQKKLYEKYTPLVNIPLVIAMWEPMAKAMGYPGPIGWQDIARLASNPKGWASLNHPEWGKFRWGHAHPDANSGFLAVISEVYASLNKKSGITADDLKRPEVVSFLKKIEGAVEHYGLSNTWIDDLMHNKGPAYLSCAVQYENTIIESNEKNKNRPFKLVAIYPREGNFWTQHPVAVLDGDWMTPQKRSAAMKFVEFLLSRDAQKEAMRMGMRPIIEGLDLGSPFDEEHGVIAKVDQSKKYTVPEENVLKRIRDLWEDVKIPATIVMVIDRSGSMNGEPINNARSGSIEFIKNMKPRDRIKIVIFNHVIAELTDYCLISRCREEIITRMAGVFAEGNTALYDVTARYYDELAKMMQAEPDRRYSLLLLTDGMDTNSRINRHDFLDRFPQGEKFDVPKIYSIAYGKQADKDLLTEISNRTNARVFISSPEEIVKTYKELSANF